ncbi:MAG: hypothetical protein LBP26_06330 [Clostridiales bacterium]|jgi:hypothetical protein|nr:hypothetical protein [Clostridiales bacterium]
MELYAEQSVNNGDIDKHAKRTRVFYGLRYVCVAAWVIVFFMIWFIPSDAQNVALQLLMNFLFGFAIVSPFVVLYIFLGRFITRTNTEFDYYLNGGIFRAVKVVNRKKRKRMVEFNLSAIESIGRVSADAYGRYAAARDVKKHIAFCGEPDEDEIVYVYFVSDGAGQLLHITPDENMLTALRRSVVRITVVDKSLNTPLKPGAGTANKDDLFR